MVWKVGQSTAAPEQNGQDQPVRTTAPKQDTSIAVLLSDIVPVGVLFDVSYDTCFLWTHDTWRRDAGGISKHNFLLATQISYSQPAESAQRRIVLLRVTRAHAPSEVLKGRSELQDAIGGVIVNRNELTMPQGQGNIGYSVLECQILGNFFDKTAEDGSVSLNFSTDMDSFDVAPSFAVYKPFGKALEYVAGYPSVLADNSASQDHNSDIIKVRIGTVRYSSSPPLTDNGQGFNDAVPVHVNARDFVSMKTAVFGITRGGKSNTMKTIATATMEYGIESSLKIGQLFFDPAGEYANVNVQDNTALTEIGNDYVVVYRLGVPRVMTSDRSVSINFFDTANIEVVWDLVKKILQPHSESDVIKRFLATDVIGPGEPDDTNYEAWDTSFKRRCALYASFIKAGFNPGDGFQVMLPVPREVLEVVNQHLPFQQHFHLEKDELQLHSTRLCVFWDCLLTAKEFNPRNKELIEWIDSGLQTILDIYSGRSGRDYLLLESLSVFHSEEIPYDYAEDIYNNLLDGRIVIVDLSIGSEAVLQMCAERIVNYILEQGTRVFGDGLEPPYIQIFIEEAHRLFSRSQVLDTTSTDPYARLAKEAAKYNIGLVYATQEVTSVNPQVLSNTANWIVTHLNNTTESQELAKYYAFADFDDLTRKADDVGFARVVTRSGRYIVPTQVDLFGPERIMGLRDQLSGAGAGSFSTPPPPVEEPSPTEEPPEEKGGIRWKF